VINQVLCFGFPPECKALIRWRQSFLLAKICTGFKKGKKSRVLILLVSAEGKKATDKSIFNCQYCQKDDRVNIIKGEALKSEKHPGPSQALDAFRILG
jgi:hypothetical protein